MGGTSAQFLNMAIVVAEALQKERQTAPWRPGDPLFRVWGSHQHTLHKVLCFPTVDGNTQEMTVLRKCRLIALSHDFNS